MQGPAEEAKPGERGVGEIALAPELQRHLDRRIKEAHRDWVDAREHGHHFKAIECGAIHDALVNLRYDFERISKERSDLANAEVRHGASGADPT